MVNAVPLNIGQVNGAGDRAALFLKVFSGEVLTAFETACVTKDKHLVRTIQSGKSASFPATWKVGAAYHTPGAEILGANSNTNERLITIDDLLVSSVFIPTIDEAMNHYDYRSIYANETGVALAMAWDRNILQVGINAARAAATVTGGFGGTTLTSATTLYRTSAVDLIAGLTTATQTLDEKDNPMSAKRYAFMRPAQYYLLSTNNDLVDKDLSANNGDKSQAKVYMVAGSELVKTNQFPTGVVNTGPVPYQGTYTPCAALVMTEQAVGTVKLMDMQSEMQWDIRRQGTLIVNKYAMGHGILRPEAAVELRIT